MGDATTLATREIMWNIPHVFKFIMYGLFLCSLAILAKGLSPSLYKTSCLPICHKTQARIVHVYNASSSCYNWLLH